MLDLATQRAGPTREKRLSMNTRQSAVHTVANAQIFANGSKKQLERIAQLSTPIEVKAGYQLTQEGTTGREFGVLIDGTATVKIDGNVVATLNAGDHYGEMALLAEIGEPGDRRSATVIADTDQLVAVMSVSEFRSVLAEYPEVADQLKASAAQRNAENNG